MEDDQNVDKKIDAYAAGTDAFLVGQSQDANPFDLATQELAHFEWNDGWMEGEDAIARLHTFAGGLTPYDLDVLHKRVARLFECSPDEVQTILQAQETTNG